MKTLKVSEMKDDVENVVGTIVFDGTNEPQLSTPRAGPHSERLRAAWQDLAAQASLPLDMNVRKEIDGQKVMEFNTTLVRKNDARYPDAVWSYLEQRYGYIVDEQV